MRLLRLQRPEGFIRIEHQLSAGILRILNIGQVGRYSIADLRIRSLTFA
jgi:hypothetical protein